MSSLRIVKVLTLFENILGVYRNYSIFSKRMKHLVKLRLIIDSILILLFFAYFINNLNNDLNNNSLMEYIFATCHLIFIVTNNVFVTFFSVYSSNKFTKLMWDLDLIRKLCENDASYVKNVNKHNKKSYIQVALSFLVLGLLVMLYIYDSWSYLHTLLVTWSLICLNSLQFRYYCESIVFYTLTDTVVSLLKYINECLSLAIQKLSIASNRGESNEEMDRMQNELDIWGEAIRLLADACKNLQDCFGLQILLSFYTATIFYIVYLYQVILYLVNQELLWDVSIWSFSLSLIAYAALKILILVGGQLAQNEADTLIAKLSRLHNLLVTISSREADECAQRARALLRRLGAAPLRVRLQRALPVRAALLVDVLAVVLNYTVILLQFNHVV